jgi:hypothetical protein
MSKHMKFAGLALLVTLGPGLSMAGTIEPCATESLSVYLTSTSVCEIGSFLFGDFYYNPTSLGGGPIVGANEVMVTPIFGTDPGLEFSASWSGTANSGIDSEIGFHVGTASGLPWLDSGTISMTATATGTANALLSAYICQGGTFSGLCATNPLEILELQLGTGENPGPQTPIGSFGPVSSISVLTDVRAYGAGDGTSSILNVTNLFPTPEPVTPLLGLSGLLLLFGLRKHLRA